MTPHELYSCLLFTEQCVEARRASGVINDQSAAHWASRGQMKEHLFISLCFVC